MHLEDRNKAKGMWHTLVLETLMPGEGAERGAFQATLMGSCQGAMPGTGKETEAVLCFCPSQGLVDLLAWGSLLPRNRVPATETATLKDYLGLWKGREPYSPTLSSVYGSRKQLTCQIFGFFILKWRHDQSGSWRYAWYISVKTCIQVPSSHMQAR